MKHFNFDVELFLTKQNSLLAHLQSGIVFLFKTCDDGLWQFSMCESKR